MSENSSARSGGIGFCGLLTIVFIVLKLLGKITRSWLWVLSRLWIVWAICLIILLIFGIIKLFTDSRRFSFDNFIG